MTSWPKKPPLVLDQAIRQWQEQSGALSALPNAPVDVTCAESATMRPHRSRGVLRRWARLLRGLPERRAPRRPWRYSTHD
jgi:hypothetical protein